MCIYHSDRPGQVFNPNILFICCTGIMEKPKEKTQTVGPHRDEVPQETTPVTKPVFVKPDAPKQRVPVGQKRFDTSPPKKLPKRKLNFDEVDHDQPLIPTGKKAYYELLGNSISKDEFIHMQSFDAEGNMVAKEVFATTKFSKFVTSVMNSNPDKSGVIIKAFLNVLNELK